MHDVETKSELMTVMDKAMCLTLQNIRTIVDRWDADMCATEVDKLHHLLEVVHNIKAIKAMPMPISK